MLLREVLGSINIDADILILKNIFSRYKNLNMFEMEYPVRCIELASNTSICVSCSDGKHHQLLELALPLKLTSQAINSQRAVITSDTDLKIKCGVFTASKITHVSLYNVN